MTWKRPTCGLNGPTTSRYDRAEELLDRLQKFAAADGWICLTDRIIGAGELGTVSPEDRVLSAALCRQQASLEVRHVGPGWSVTEIEQVGGTAYWPATQVFRAVPPGELRERGVARFLTYWPTAGLALDAGTAPVGPACTRFAGFGPGEGD